MIIDLPFWSMKTFEINDYSFANDRMGNHKATGLATYLQTPMIGSGAPAQKPNRSETCISLSMRLSVYSVNMPYRACTGMVGTAPKLPTIGLTGTLRGPVCCLSGLHTGKRAGPVLAHPLARTLPVHVPYGGPYSFAHTDLGRICPRISLTDRFQQVSSRYRTVSFCPTG